ncbi:RUN and FYVE domain-containing protein 2 isoform X2 [Diabrotica virgifera virgifera]|uniref:RUN and FYVE domain-containing protein 2-like isoform X2 n=1 Tax=Diabrotica virgifera virgifera TaxID=50390 RepID=A0A6P7FFJ3_DIAVI|nr:RUN and FYVE domain-containing protein 2 isoform X2 [Diabrotica virgifera virgifera]
MAAASSENSPTTPSDSFNLQRNTIESRSPSISSVNNFLFTSMLVSKPGKKKGKKSKGRDPVVIERSNLVNISKLVVKELIEQSLRYGRMLDSDHMPLQHFFIVLEHVLRHGLRPKKGLLGPKKELWDILQMVEKYTPEAQDITASVRDLPTVRTHMGRARAWLRLALMQKKLADYLKVLIDHKDEALVEYFEPDALMLSDEAIIIIGLLVGLNVIDCNLCVKEEDLDCPQGVIDFSLYLRSSSHVSTDSSNEEQGDAMITVLDQKNYIEELNRHLNATVANLQTKVESLTTTNALMKEDLAIAKNNLLALYDENRQLRLELGKESDGYALGISGVQITKVEEKETKEISKLVGSEVEELKHRLEEERKLRQEADNELEIQMCMKAEMEVAMKLLEKDIHEKQDTIISLRRQLDDIKLINLEMYKKLQESEASLRHKTEFITKLEAKAQSMTDTIQSLENKYRESESNRVTAEQLKREVDMQAAQVEEQATNIEGDLKVEREWRISLQATMQQDRERISKLQIENGQLKMIAQKYAQLQEEYYTLKDQCLEQEHTLEELGGHLRESKLQISDLREEITKSRPEGSWAKDHTAAKCKACTKEFNLTRRRHHCRNCGEIFCNACSDNTMPLPSSAKPVRVCDDCHLILLGRTNSVMN